MDATIEKDFSNLFKTMLIHRKLQLIRAINRLKEDVKFIASYDTVAMDKYMKELNFLEEYDESLSIVYDFEFTDTKERL